MRIAFPLPALASAVLLVSGGAALAQQANPAPPVTEASSGAAPAAAPRKERKVCRSSVSSYSRVTARVCKTKAEWAAEDKAHNNSEAETVYR